MPPRQRARLRMFVAEYIAGRKDVKPSSKTVWRQGERSLNDYFGTDRLVEQVTRAEAEGYKQWLIGQGLALYTVRKRLQVAKMFFSAMVDRDLIRANPFTGVQVAAVVDEGRNVYVSCSDIEKVMPACPDAEWRAITEWQSKGETPVNAGKCAWVRHYTTVQADGEGFEPPVDLRPQQFSRLPP